MSKKRVLTFQTPKKKAATPLRPSKPAEKNAVVQKSIESPFKDDTLENKLIEAYRDENEMLRNMKKDALLYNKLLGISIDQDGSRLNFAIERDSSTGRKKLKFHLDEREDIYVFSLEDSMNCNVPEYFYDVIEFDKKAFPLFFYKAMQAVYEVRTNE